MNFLKKLKELKKIKCILGWHHGGVHKRIDENRELLMLLQKEVPALLEQKPWVYQWLKSNDDFLMDLSQATDISSSRFGPKEPTKVNGHFSFPRAFPEQAPQEK
ncbi:MAG: hypothetical protein RBR37_14805 [Advenella sp.]|nr:hypothetical protein [Advenella sp.]